MGFSTLHPLYPQRSMNSSDGTAVASQSLTVSTSAVAFGTAFKSTTNLIVFDVQGQNVRTRWDGTDPTSTVGHILYAGQAYTWDKAQAAAAKFIRISTAASDATIFASEFSA